MATTLSTIHVAALVLRIVGVEHLKEGARFLSQTFREGVVFHGVFTRGLKFIPQALDEGQTLGRLVDSWKTVTHDAREYRTKLSNSVSGFGLHNLMGS